MKNVVVFDQAESFGGSIARMLDVIEDTPNIDYLLFSYLHKSKATNRRHFTNLTVKRLFSFFNYQKKQNLENLLIKKNNELIVGSLYIKKIIALLDLSNEIFVTLQMQLHLVFKNIDILISNSNIHAVSMRLSNTLSCKHIIIFRSLDYLGRWKSNLQQIDYFVFISRPLQEFYCSELAINENQCKVIGDPVDADSELMRQIKLDNHLPLTIKSKKKEFIFLCVGRICEQKGQLDACQAFFKSNTWPQSQLILLGGIDPDTTSQRYHKKIIEFIAEHGLDKHIQIVGFQNNPLVWMKKADIVLHCATMFEGLGSSVIEAMQLGKVVIASDNGGPSSFIKNSINGYLYPSRNIDKLSHLIHQLHEKKDDLKDIELHAKLDATKLFSRTRISNQFIKLYQTTKN